MNYRKVKTSSIYVEETSPYSGLCWACGNKTTFMPLQGVGTVSVNGQPVQGQLTFPDAMVWHEDGANAVGWRSCSNSDCSALVTVSRRRNSRGEVEFFPRPGVEMRRDGIPAPVLTALDEAISCYRVSAFRGAAALIRRAVEITCDDQGAKPVKGHLTLGPRIDLLKGKLSPDVLEAMHSVKFLGNDAMHIDAEDFDDIGLDQVDAAFVVTLEVLRQLYQAKAILASLAKLRKVKE